jgi:hypothetical protein
MNGVWGDSCQCRRGMAVLSTGVWGDTKRRTLFLGTASILGRLWKAAPQKERVLLSCVAVGRWFTRLPARMRSGVNQKHRQMPFLRDIRPVRRNRHDGAWCGAASLNRREILSLACHDRGTRTECTPDYKSENHPAGNAQSGGGVSWRAGSQNGISLHALQHAGLLLAMTA